MSSDSIRIFQIKLVYTKKSFSGKSNQFHCYLKIRQSTTQHSLLQLRISPVTVSPSGCQWPGSPPEMLMLKSSSSRGSALIPDSGHWTNMRGVRALCSQSRTKHKCGHLLVTSEKHLWQRKICKYNDFKRNGMLFIESVLKWNAEHWVYKYKLINSSVSYIIDILNTEWGWNSVNSFILMCSAMLSCSKSECKRQQLA